MSQQDRTQQRHQQGNRWETDRDDDDIDLDSNPMSW